MYAAVVWGGWGVLTVVGLAFAGVYGRDCPFMDEWGMLAALAGDEDAVAWVVRPHHEHWYPVPRLLFLGLFRLTGDLRPAMLLSTLLLSAAAAGCVRAAGLARGRQSTADLFFPLAFLHAGHWENVLMAYQVCFTLTAALGAGLVVVANRPVVPGWGRVGFAVVASLLLTGCGAAGLFFSAAGAAWLVVTGRRHARSGEWGKVAAAWAGVGAVVAVFAGVVATYPGSPLSPDRRAVDLVRFAARATAMAFGPSNEWLWPVETVGVLVATRAGLRAARAAGGTRSVGLGAVLAGTGGLIAALTWGRGWAGPDVAAASRYSALLLPGAAAAFLLAVGHPSRWARVGVPAGLAGLAAAAWPANLAVGIDQASRISHHADALGVDLRDGLPPDLIGERYDWQLFLTSPKIGQDLDTATRIGFGPFRGRAPVTMTTTTRPADHPPGSLRFGLDAPPGTVAVRIRGEFVPQVSRMADYRVRWREAGSAGWHEERFQVVKCLPAGVVVRVRGRPTEVEVLPDRAPGEYRVTGVEWVVGGEPW